MNPLWVHGNQASPQTRVEEAAKAYDAHRAAIKSCDEHAEECIAQLKRVPTESAEKLVAKLERQLEIDGCLGTIDPEEWEAAIAEAASRAA